MVKVWRDWMASKFLCKCILVQGLLLGMEKSQECLHPAIRLLSAIVPVTSKSEEDGAVGRVEPHPLLLSSRKNPLVIQPWEDGPTLTERQQPLLLLFRLRKVGWLVPQMRTRKILPREAFYDSVY